LLTDEINFINK